MANIFGKRLFLFIFVFLAVADRYFKLNSTVCKLQLCGEYYWVVSIVRTVVIRRAIDSRDDKEMKNLEW